MRRLNDLLNYVKNNLTKQKTLSNVFEAYAKENNLNKYSVRNLYYYGLKELEENDDMVYDAVPSQSVISKDEEREF